MTEPRPSSWLSGLVLLICCVLGGGGSTWAFVLNLRDGSYSLERSKLWEGATAQEVAQSFSKTGLSAWLAERGREVSWLALQDLGPQVRQGCPGWLFLTDELQIHRDGASHADQRARIVHQLADHFSSRGIQLLVAVVPDKTRVLRSQLCEQHRPAVLDARVDDWLARLTADGRVKAVNLVSALQPLGEQAFLRTDTHWSEAGAKASAGRVGDQLRSQGFRAEAPQSFDIQAEAPAPRLGDLVRLAGVNGLPRGWQPAGESVAASTIRIKATEGGDLFGDEELPAVALVGTSYSRTSNFLSWLEVTLQARVGQFAKDGAEFSGSMLPYLQSSAFRETPPRYLLWEIPERYLEAPITAQDRALQNFLKQG